MAQGWGSRGGTGRRLVVDLAFVAAGAAAVIEVVQGPPAGNGYGWGSVVISAIVVAAPLVVLGLAVRAAEPRFAWLTMALAAVMAVFVLLALVGNWPGQPLTDNALDSVLTVLVLATCVGTWVEELPLLGRPAH
ncbi:MAG: hypothetical protein WAV00_07175 [Nocardioides sp.]